MQAETVQRPLIGWTVNSERDGMFKEAVFVQFEET